MTLAHERLATLAAWLAASSKSRPAPTWGTINVGPYAVIVAADEDAAPEPAFDAQAFPIFVPSDQAAGLALPAIDTTAPANQPGLADRVAHILWKIEAGQLPPAAVIGLESPAEPLGDAISGAGADGVDRDAFPILCVPLWALAADDHDSLSRRLPVIPR